MTDSIYLCVMSDDFGMHPAINEGIAKAFTDGLLTDTNIMAPCPAFHEAAAIARQIGLPTGFHATVTCDWDLYRWGPLTKAPSLVDSDGYFKNLSALAWKDATDEDVLAELTAQIAAIEAEGIKSTHSSYHMDHDGKGRLFRILGEIGTQRVGPMRSEDTREKTGIPTYHWDSIFCTTAWTLDPARRKANLMGLLRHMQPGYHQWMVHAAVDSASLDEMCSPEYPARNWARPFRAADMALLMDAEVKDMIAERGIQRIPVTDAPVE